MEDTGGTLVMHCATLSTSKNLSSYYYQHLIEVETEAQTVN